MRVKILPISALNPNIVPLTLGLHNFEIEVVLHINEQIWIPKAPTNPISNRIPTFVFS